MLENGKINRLQLWLLMINFTIGSALLLIPSIVAFQSKQDGWIAMLVATTIGALLLFIMVTLANRYPKLTIVEISQELLGSILGKIVGIMYAWFFLHLSALVIRNALDFLVAIILPETPMIAVGIMPAILIFFTVMNGIEVVGRSNELFTPYAAGGFWVTVLLVIPLMNIENIQPVLNNGIKPVLKGAFPVIGFPFTELVVFLMILPFISNREHIKKIFISGGMVGGFSLFVIILASLLVLNILPSGLSVYPTFILAKLINIADFLTRVEAVISLTYLLIISTKIFVSFYGGMLAVAQVFNLSDYRPIISPLLIIVMTLSITLNSNITENFDFAGTTWAPYSFLFGFFIPLLLLGISYVKK